METKANSQRSERLLEALLLWQKDLLPSQTLRNVVRETMRDADRGLLERFELSSGDEVFFKEICGQLITKLAGTAGNTVFEGEHAAPRASEAAASQQVQIRKVTPPTAQFAAPGVVPPAETPDVSGFQSPAFVQTGVQNPPAPTSQIAPTQSAPVATAQPAMAEPAVRRQPAELDFEVEFLPDLEEPPETGPLRVFDPIMAFQKVDGMIRFASMDWLSIPRIMAFAIIGAVASLPFVIESPALDPNATNQYASPRNVGLNDSQSEEKSEESSELLPTDSEENGDLSGGFAAQEPGEEETSAVGSSSNAPGSDASSTDDPYAIFNTEERVAEDGSAADALEQEEPIDLDSVLAPFLGDAGDTLEGNSGEVTTKAISRIISSIENGDYEKAEEGLRLLSDNDGTLPWFRAEMALREKNFASRRDAWLALLSKPETSLTDDLLCARLLLSSSSEERGKLVKAARGKLSATSASKSAARYMRWCLCWSNDRDWAKLISENASAQAGRENIDSIFVAIATFAADDIPSAHRGLVDSKVGLQTLQFGSSTEVETWIGKASVQDLTRRVTKSLSSLSGGRLTVAPR